MSTGLNFNGGSQNQEINASKSQATDRRRKRRVQVSAAVRVRAVERVEAGQALDEITTTINISRLGILIQATDRRFLHGMDVAVTLPYSAGARELQAEQPGRIIWISPNPDGTSSVAIALGLPADDFRVGYSHAPIPEDEIQLPRTAKATTAPPPIAANRPLILLMDRNAETRENLASYLNGEGYHVIVAATADEARKMLCEITPSVVVGEIEGEGMPGYDLCAHCKATPRLQTVPVVLMTASGFPSDYSGAHAVGAVVCMVKPFKQERLGHVVRMLAPPPHIKNDVPPPHRIDPARRTFVPKRKTDTPTSFLRRLRMKRG